MCIFTATYDKIERVHVIKHGIPSETYIISNWSFDICILIISKNIPGHNEQVFLHVFRTHVCQEQ